MGGPTVEHDFDEAEDGVLDTLTREQLEDAALQYDEHKQVSGQDMLDY
jgi:hypothetical protein